MIYIINKSPFSSKALDSCLNVAQEGDTILLIEDGVYAAGTNSKLKKATEKHITVYALQADLTARGIESAVSVVDYLGFVELVEKDTAVSWR